MKIKVFIQARMSSSRFPGKVLAPVNGSPMITRVIEAAARVVDKADIVVATSSEISDEPLSLYVDSLGVNSFRGPLDDVFERFRSCLAHFPCEWFFRLSADSPLLNSALLSTMVTRASSNLDLVTNVQKRTFPHGHSAELLRSETFAAIDPLRLSADDREHVTKFYYSHPQEFRILNLENTDPEYGRLNLVVDTVDDLQRIEAMETAGKLDFGSQMKASVL